MDTSKKVIMVTGANSGIGKVTALECAKTGANIIMVCRSRERGEVALTEIKKNSGNPNISLLVADLSSLQSIRKMVTSFADRYDRLDVLVNNAGAVFPECMKNEEEIELTFATNHLGYFRLTNLLLDTIKKSAPARIVNVSSEAHRFTGRDSLDFQSTKRYSSFAAYGKSKCANILFTRELARRLEGTGVTVNCLHPGFVNTNFGKSRKKSVVMDIARSILSVTPEKGAETSIFLALSDTVNNITGKYFSNKKMIEPSRMATNDKLAIQLWDESIRLGV